MRRRAESQLATLFNVTSKLPLCLVFGQKVQKGPCHFHREQFVTLWNTGTSYTGK